MTAVLTGREAGHAVIGTILRDRIVRVEVRPNRKLARQLGFAAWGGYKHAAKNGWRIAPDTPPEQLAGRICRIEAGNVANPCSTLTAGAAARRSTSAWRKSSQMNCITGSVGPATRRRRGGNAGPGPPPRSSTTPQSPASWRPSSTSWAAFKASPSPQSCNRSARSKDGAHDRRCPRHCLRQARPQRFSSLVAGAPQ